MHPVRENLIEPVSDSGRKKERKKDRRTPQQSRNLQQNTCKFCNKLHTFGRNYFPAWEKTCNACGLKNHLAGSIICQNKIITEQNK